MSPTMRQIFFMFQKNICRSILSVVEWFETDVGGSDWRSLQACR